MSICRSDFLREEGLKDKQLDSELIPVQKAVFQLAKSGGCSGAELASSLNHCAVWLKRFNHKGTRTCVRRIAKARRASVTQQQSN